MHNPDYVIDMYTHDLHRTLPFDELIRRCNSLEPKEEYFVSPVNTRAAVCRRHIRATVAIRLTHTHTHRTSVTT